MPPRQHPLLSPVAIVSTILLLLSLGAALYFTGGRAFSPGQLSAISHSGMESGGFTSHASFADDCNACHVPFGGVSAEKCTDCHTTIADHRTQQTGLHGRLAETACTSCHTEHIGTENDLFATALDQFTSDHHAVLFVLDGAHAERDCIDCHADEQYVATPADCVGCHSEPDLHANLFGTDCAACHTTAEWQPARLAMHQFPLDHGDDGQIPCATCHVDSMATFTCVDCHASAEMVDEHDELRLTSAELNACTTCHVTGTSAETERLEEELLLGD
jgi:hypothetical protein